MSTITHDSNSAILSHQYNLEMRDRKHEVNRSSNTNSEAQNTAELTDESVKGNRLLQTVQARSSSLNTANNTLRDETHKDTRATALTSNFNTEGQIEDHFRVRSARNNGATAHADMSAVAQREPHPFGCGVDIDICCPPQYDDPNIFLPPPPRYDDPNIFLPPPPHHDDPNIFLPPLYDDPNILLPPVVDEPPIQDDMCIYPEFPWLPELPRRPIRRPLPIDLEPIKDVPTNLGMGMK